MFFGNFAKFVETKHKAMELEEAIKILEQHNKWRRGGKSEMPTPHLIGEAIDTVVTSYYIAKTLEVKPFEAICDSAKIKVDITPTSNYFDPKLMIE